MHEFELDVDYTPTTKQLALIAMVLEVDKELEPEVLTREIVKKEKGFLIKVFSSSYPDSLKGPQEAAGCSHRHLQTHQAYS